MPLTSANRVYKNFPNIFAENVTQHVKRRAESYRLRNHNDLVLQTLDDDEISEVCDLNTKDDEAEIEPTTKSSLTHSRLTPEMRMLRTRRTSATGNAFVDYESDASSTPTTPTPSTTPRSRTSPSPRGVPVNIIESPRPLSGGSFVPAFSVSPRKPRSPRTTCSLDNVDLWEESDSESDSQKTFDIINGMSINPSKTFDLADLRRSRSPVACKRNKIVEETPVKKDRSKSRSNERRESRATTKSRTRVNRRLKTIFGNTRTAKTPQTIHESSENDENEGQQNSNESKPDDSKLLSIRGSRIAASFSNLKPKQEVFATKTDISTLSKNMKSNSSVYKSNRPSYSAKADKICPCLEVSPQLAEGRSSPTLGNVKSGALEEMSSDTSSTIKNAKPPANVTKPENNALNKLKHSPPSGSPHGSPSGGRRVKFNSFVTVREDELSTLEFLKKSTDTARVFKNRYLGSRDCDMDVTNTFSQTIH